jgi:hypothetical protein
MNTTPSDTHGTAAERLIADYLERLDRAAADLPDGTRAELLADIRGHLSETAGASPGEAAVRQILGELGEPEEIVAAAAPEAADRPSRSGRTDRTGGELAYDVTTVLVLLLGGFVVPVLGWIAGVVMLWNGPRWRRRHKWTGTLLWPAATAVGVIALMVAHRGGPGPLVILIALAVILIGLITGFTYLLRATRPAH